MTSAKTQPCVLFLHPSAEYQSMDRILVQLVAAVDRTRWQPVVVIPRRGPLIGALEELGAIVEVGDIGAIGHGFAPIRVASIALRLPLCLWFVASILRRYRPTVVHIHSRSVLGGALAARFFARHRLWHLHVTLSKRSLVDRLSARIARALASGVICSSKAARDALLALEPSLGARTRVIRNAVDTGRVASRDTSDRNGLRAKLGVDEDTTLIVLVGRIAPTGGQRLFLDAARRVRIEHPDAQFLMVGDPAPGHRSLIQRLDREIAAAKLEGIVHRLPFQRRIRSVYAAADIVCVAAESADPVQMVALEAMAAGRPVVLSAHAGATEVARSGETALLFPPEDVTRLAWSLGSLIADAPRRTAMGHAARALHANEFVVGRFRNEFDRAWSQLSEREFLLPEKRARVIHLALGKSNLARANGVNHVVHHLAAAQAAQGLDVEVWGITRDPEAETPDRPYPLVLFRRGVSRFVLHPSLARALAALDATAIVHLHGAYVAELCAAAKRLRRQRVPYVLTPHGAYREQARARSAWRKRLWMLLAERRMLRGARAVQALSARELDEMQRAISVERICVIPNGQSAVELRAPLPSPVGPGAMAESANPRRPVFAYCGRLSIRTKGLDMLLEGFARYAVARGDGSLWIIGDGVGREVLEKQADELGISRRVLFFGALFGDEKLNLLARADAFVHPSRHEGMPTAVLEAGALGLPLMVTPGTNLDEDVAHARAGLVIPTVSAEAIAAALSEAEELHGRGELAARGDAARQLVHESFSWSRVATIAARELYGLSALPLRTPPDPVAESAPRPVQHQPAAPLPRPGAPERRLT